MELLRNTFLSILFFTFQLEIRHGLAQNPHSQVANKTELEKCCASTKLLTSVMKSISVHTQIPLTILNASNINAVSKDLQNLSTQCASTWSEERVDGTLDVFKMRCQLYGDNVLTVNVSKDVTTYLSLAVQDKNMPIYFPRGSIKTFCNAHFKPPCPDIIEDKCDANICKACFETFQSRNCASLDTYCRNMVTIDGTTPCHSFDAFQGNGSQSGGADILPIVIASIASFIAGVIVCLLVLCLLRHRRERPCFKSATSEDGSSKPKQETHEGLQGQSNRRNIPEHLGLQDVNPESRTELGAKRSQPSAPQQAIVYETSDKRRSEHVYSELGDIPSMHQTNELPENKRGNKGHINGAMGQDRDPISETDGADGCYSQKHDYFVLEKENHKPNESEMSAGTKSNGQRCMGDSLESEPDDNNTQSSDYFVLEKETHNPNEFGMSAGTKSDGQGRLNDSLQSEPDDNNTQPNDYFVLEKEDKAVNEVERVEDIKIDDTHLEADDDVDDDYHSYHVLEKQ